MALLPKDRNTFTTLNYACKHGQLVLLECTDEHGRYVPVVCLVGQVPEDTDMRIIPLAKLFTGNPYDEVFPPSDVTSSGAKQREVRRLN